jgi:copper homeostasis protein
MNCKTKKILLEICTASLDDAVAAQAGGADRIELNSSLILGGLTPSLGTLIETKKALRIPVMCMIRPRSGGFCYTENEMIVMERDTELAVEQGADGIVFGVLKENGTVDISRCKRLIKRMGMAQRVFHRALDVTPDPFKSLYQLVDMGVHRVMTSGQEDSVYSGTELIRRLIDHAAGRIEILPGGGIDKFNLQDVIARTGCRQVHLALHRSSSDRSCSARPHVFFGGMLRPSEDMYSVTESQQVTTIRKLLS